jgi:hypothetical protein
VQEGDIGGEMDGVGFGQGAKLLLIVMPALGAGIHVL